MVFRRDNKVDSFQRQMNALRNQLGNAGEGEDDAGQLDELDDAYPDSGYRDQAESLEQDSSAYSFGTYPASAGQATTAPETRANAPEVPQMPGTDDTVSVVGRGTTWKGDLEIETSLQVFGRFEGTIRAREDVWIAEGADVDATINAQRVVVGGNVAGTIAATERFEALPSGQVTADVTAPVSVVHEGAVINGAFRIGTTDTPGEGRERSGTPSVIQRRSRTGS